MALLLFLDFLMLALGSSGHTLDNHMTGHFGRCIIPCLPWYNAAHLWDGLKMPLPWGLWRDTSVSSRPDLSYARKPSLVWLDPESLSLVCSRAHVPWWRILPTLSNQKKGSMVPFMASLSLLPIHGTGSSSPFQGTAACPYRKLFPIANYFPPQTTSHPTSVTCSLGVPLYGIKHYLS